MHCHNGKRLASSSRLGIGEDASGSVFWMEKEVMLMTDFELLSLVISIISLVIIVLKK